MSFDFKSVKVLVVGDLMIDNYIMGSSSRLSPEAPVPVIRPTSNYSIAGGAANVAMNMSSLGAQVSCAGVIGDDLWGEKLLSILNEKGIDSTYINKIKNFKTTLKQRIYSNDIQIARIDIEENLEQRCSFMDENFNNYDVIILSDYNKGVLTTNWFQRPENTTVFLDPKKSFINFNQCDIITPNLNELKQLSGNNITSENDIKESCKIILKKYKLKYIIAKRGEEGITIIGNNNYVKHLKARFVETPDVTGAGDTVISSISLAFAVTNDIEKSAEFAINASALAVSKPGTATVTIYEINNYINTNE
jgi:rfaE bifunctional protein kinase chain/domain